MSAVVDVAELQARLEEYLARAHEGERILVRREDGSRVALGPAGPEGAEDLVQRRRHRSDRTIAEVLAEDRGS